MSQWDFGHGREPTEHHEPQYPQQPPYPYPEQQEPEYPYAQEPRHPQSACPRNRSTGAAAAVSGRAVSGRAAAYAPQPPYPLHLRAAGRTEAQRPTFPTLRAGRAMRARPSTQC